MDSHTSNDPASRLTTDSVADPAMEKAMIRACKAFGAAFDEELDRLKADGHQQATPNHPAE